jgi:hypothetical protein
MMTFLDGDIRTKSYIFIFVHKKSSSSISLRQKILKVPVPICQYFSGMHKYSNTCHILSWIFISVHALGKQTVYQKDSTGVKYPAAKREKRATADDQQAS